MKIFLNTGFALLLTVFSACQETVDFPSGEKIAIIVNVEHNAKDDDVIFLRLYPVIYYNDSPEEKEQKGNSFGLRADTIKASINGNEKVFSVDHRKGVSTDIELDDHLYKLTGEFSPQSVYSITVLYKGREITFQDQFLSSLDTVYAKVDTLLWTQAFQSVESNYVYSTFAYIDSDPPTSINDTLYSRYWYQRNTFSPFLVLPRKVSYGVLETDSCSVDISYSIITKAQNSETEYIQIRQASNLKKNIFINLGN